MIGRVMEELIWNGATKRAEGHTEMAVYYSQPKLTGLSQGERISFIRQLRHMSQEEFGKRLGINSIRVCSIVRKTERKSRDIRADKLEKICKILEINPKMVDNWKFRDPEDLYYELLWLEELCPEIMIKNKILEKPKNETYRFLFDKYIEWKTMRKKYAEGKITYEEYWDWKLRKPDGKGHSEQ